MSEFLAAYQIHRVPRFEEGESLPVDAGYGDVDIDALLELIKKNAHQFHGSLLRGEPTKAIYTYSCVSEALNASIAIQKELDALNAKHYLAPINLVTVGIVSYTNPFTKVREDERSLELASFLAESAGIGELYMSEGAFNALSDHERLQCRFSRQLIRTGEEWALNAFEVYWNPREVELGKLHRDPDIIDLDIQPIRSFGLKLVFSVLFLFFAVLVMTVGIEPMWLYFIRLIYR
jgi:hypothetical protein